MSVRRALLGAALAGALLLFAGVPLLAVLGAALGPHRAAAWQELLDPGGRAALLHTLLLAGGVTTLALILGTALAWLCERTDLLASEAGRGRLYAVLGLPLAIPPYLLAMAWATLGNGRTGLLNRAGAWLDVYGFDGMLLCLGTSAYPFVLLAARAALVRADPSLEEAARVHGAGPRQVLWHVTLPLLRPALAHSAGLVFVFTAAAFGVPYLLGQGAQPPVLVLTTRIFQHTALGGAEPLARAAAQSLLLLILALLVQGGLAGLAARSRAVQVGGKAARSSRVELGRWRRPLLALVLAFAAVFVALPLLTIALSSLSTSVATPLELTYAHWANVLARGETGRAMLHSLLLAMGTGGTCALLGILVAELARRGGRGGALLAAAAAAPYAVPGTVLAIGLILAFSQELRLILFEQVRLVFFLPGTLWLLFAAYAVKHLAFGVRTAQAGLEQIHPALEEAARTSGASARRAFQDVLLPLLRPALAASFVMVALPCFSELTMSVLLFGAHTETTGTLLFELQSYADPAAGAVVATMIALLALLGDHALRALERRAEGAR